VKCLPQAVSAAIDHVVKTRRSHGQVCLDTHIRPRAHCQRGGRPRVRKPRALARPTLQFLANAAPPGGLIFFRRRASPFRVSCAASEISEGARDAGVATDPRTSAPHGAEATRWRTGPGSVNCRKSAGSPASRARCLRLAPRDPRWADLSGAAPFSGFRGSAPTHRSRDQTAPGGRYRGTVLRRRPLVTRGWRAGTTRLGPPARAQRSAPTGHRPNRPDVSGPVPKPAPAHLRRHRPGRPRT
jgi:hypothetical protein